MVVTDHAGALALPVTEETDHAEVLEIETGNRAEILMPRELPAEKK
jgi:hypothetical protein